MLKLNAQRMVSRVFPILTWSRSYDVQTGVGDLIAGITVALTLIPQSIAYASLAGFEPQYGLYASLAGGFVYGIMGACPQINIGPTALLSLLTFTYTHGTNPDCAVLLCFFCGVIQIVAGSVQLGDITPGLPKPRLPPFETTSVNGTVTAGEMLSHLGSGLLVVPLVGIILWRYPQFA